MKNKLLLPLLVLLPLVILAVWWIGNSDEGLREQQLTELAPGDSVAIAPTGTKNTSLPELATPAAEAPQREEVAEEEGESEPVELSPREAPVSNAVWVSGRVVFPDRMPNDFDEVTVTARGRRFSEKDDSRREHTAVVDRDGAFRVAFSKDTKKGWLDVKGRYLYLPEKVRLEMDELPDEIVIEPEMGGVVTGVVKAPVGAQWNEATLEGAYVQINKWSRESRVSRSSDIDEQGRFTLMGLPPGNDYNLQVNLPRWSDAREGDIEVRSGEVSELNLETVAGSTISGQVVNNEGVGRAEASVELSGEPTDGSWLHETTKTDEDGNFHFYGVKDAEVTIKAVMDEFLPVEKELGYVAEGSQRVGILLTIDEGHFISGTVQWPDGTPAANAWVSISQERETEGLRFMFDDAATERSAADGTFKITGLEPSVCVVRASAKSFRQQELDKAKERAKEGRSYKLRARGPTYKVRVEDIQPGTTGLVLTLVKGDSLSGKVVDDEGNGLTNFVVSAQPTGGDLEREDSINRVVVSLDGSFTIDGLQDGDWKVRAKAKGHQATEEITVTSPGAADIELVAYRYSEISGVVLSPGGEPISGARVWIDTLDEDEEFELEKVGKSWGEDASTNQRGEFTARDVRAGRVRVAAGAEGFGSSQGVLVQTVAGEEAQGVRLQLRSAARIRGQLHPSTGQLSDRRITIQAEGGGYWDNTQTDSSGSFEVEDLDAGTYRLTLQKEGTDEEEMFAMLGSSSSSAKTVAARVELKAGQTASVTLGAPPSNPTTVTGVVTSGGERMSGVLVSCRASNDGDFNNDAARTDDSGEYTLTVKDSGRFTFKVGAPGGGLTSHTKELQQGDNPNVDFALSTGRISGAVIGMDGRPKSGCQLTLVVVELVEGAASASNRDVKTDGDGRYQFEYIDPGKYYLRVNDGRRSWRSRNRTQAGTQVHDGIVMEEGGKIEGLNFELQEAGTIEGHVTDVDGTPASRARIRVETLSGHSAYVGRSYSTNDQGNFEYENLGEGRFLVYAEKDGARSDTVEVRVSSGGASEVQLTLESE